MGACLGFLPGVQTHSSPKGARIRSGTLGFDWESVFQPFPDPWDVLGAGGSDQSLGTLPWGSHVPLL